MRGRDGDTRKLLLHSGNIRTLDPVQPIAQAIVIDGGRISWVGRNDDILGVPVDEYKLLHLRGRTVIPSFGDAHVHFAFFAQSLVNLDLDGCSSYAKALNLIRHHARRLKKGEWLVGKGWSKDQWSDGGMPHRKDLDKLVPDNPAALLSKDEHLLWTNSVGLNLGGIDADTPDPDGGMISRDESGEATGILFERASFLVFRLVPKPSADKVARMIDSAVSYCHSKGVTAVGNFDDIENFGLLMQYHHSRCLKLRIRQFVPVHYLDELILLRLRSGFGDQYLNISGVKIFADGALGSQTALMFQPYSGSRRNRGVEVTPEKEMKKLIKRAAAGGLASSVHAIGDRANHQVLNAFEALPERLRRLRHRIEHVQIIRPEDVQRLADLDIIASVQPIHCSSDVKLMKKYLNRKGSRDSYPFRDILNAGAKVAFGSDAPIETLDPKIGIKSAVTRESLDGAARHQVSQRLTVPEAIDGFTRGVAYAIHDERVFGSITPGMRADIIILDNDPISGRGRNFVDFNVLATFFDGECVYGEEILDEI
jgi:predicted amidohydrolase YtcJ